MIALAPIWVAESSENLGRAIQREFVGPLVHTFHRSELMFRRKRDPQLKATRAASLAGGRRHATRRGPP